MNISIQIECETIKEFRSHLQSLTEQIVRETTRLNLDEFKDDFVEHVNHLILDDDNCYGSHTVTIGE